MSRQSLSCFIIAKDEADRIARCVEAAAKVAQEVLVIDSGSTDGTQAAAEAAGARVIFNAWPGYGPQKRFGEKACANDWVLNLDADEVLTDELISEIKVLMRSEPPLPGYRIKLTTVYPHHDKPRLWADYHDYIRLYDRRIMGFRESPIYDTVDEKGLEVGTLKAIALHYRERSLAHMRAKLDSYTSLQSRTVAKPKLALVVRLPFEYPLSFLSYYLRRRNFTGGLYGLAFSHAGASMRVKRLLKFLKAGVA